MISGPDIEALQGVGRIEMSSGRRPGAVWLYAVGMDLSEAPDAASLWETGAPSLMDVIGEYGYPDERFAGAGQYDGARLGRPFADFALVGPHIEDHHRLCGELAEFFRATYGDLAEKAPSFAFFPSPDVVRSKLYFGVGVHVPRQGSMPIGRLSVRQSGGDGEWVSPVIGHDFDARPAGFYAGQQALVAATWVNEAPALLDLARISDGQEHQHFSIFLGARDRGSRPRIGVHTGLRAGAQLQTTTEVHLADLSSPSGVVLPVSDRRIAVRYQPDIRPYRLVEKPPSGPFLSLEGIVLPNRWFAEGERGGAASGQLDFDETLVPLTSPLQPRRYSLQAERHGLLPRKPQLYDWLDRKWRSYAHVGLGLRDCVLDRVCKGWMVSRSRDVAFGYVNLTDLSGDPVRIGNLLECGGAASVGEGRKTWSDLFSTEAEVTFDFDDGRLVVADADGFRQLGARVLVLSSADRTMRATPVDQVSVTLAPDARFIVGGMLWRFYLPPVRGSAG